MFDKIRVCAENKTDQERTITYSCLKRGCKNLLDDQIEIPHGGSSGRHSFYSLYNQRTRSGLSNSRTSCPIQPAL